MVCPVCKNTIQEASKVCPICHANLDSIQFPNPGQKTLKKKDKATIFCLFIIGIGSLIFLFLIFSLFTKKENKVNEPALSTTVKIEPTTEPISLNKGMLSSFRYPLKPSNIGLATFIDKKNEKETDVDVYGIKFLLEEEKASLIANAKEPLKAGFSWEALAYQVAFHDLNYLNTESIVPTMDVKVYLPTGCDFVVVGEHNIELTAQVFGENKPIKNGQVVDMQVLYQIPENTAHAICIGSVNKKMACFTK